jgi:hypothetical protein
MGKAAEVTDAAEEESLALSISSTSKEEFG